MTSTPRTIGLTIDIGSVRPNPKRLSFAIFNKHATATLYMKEGSQVSADNGIPIYPRGNVSISFLEDGETVREQWSLISDTVGTPVVIFQGVKK